MCVWKRNPMNEKREAAADRTKSEKVNEESMECGESRERVEGRNGWTREWRNCVCVKGAAFYFGCSLSPSSSSLSQDFSSDFLACTGWSGSPCFLTLSYIKQWAKGRMETWKNVEGNQEGIFGERRSKAREQGRKELPEEAAHAPHHGNEVGTEDREGKEESSAFLPASTGRKRRGRENPLPFCSLFTGRKRRGREKQQVGAAPLLEGKLVQIEAGNNTWEYGGNTPGTGGKVSDQVMRSWCSNFTRFGFTSGNKCRPITNDHFLTMKNIFSDEETKEEEKRRERGKGVTKKNKSRMEKERETVRIFFFNRKSVHKARQWRWRRCSNNRDNFYNHIFYDFYSLLFISLPTSCPCSQLPIHYFTTISPSSSLPFPFKSLSFT